jgi:hypothetical protein
MTADLPEAAKEAMLGQIALGRLGEPADIARAVAFLAGRAPPTSPAKPCTSTAGCTCRSIRGVGAAGGPIAMDPSGNAIRLSRTLSHETAP